MRHVTFVALTMGAMAFEASAVAKTFEDGIVRGEEVHPVSVSVNGAGNTVVDFGKHGFGWIEVDVERLPGFQGGFRHPRA